MQAIRTYYSQLTRLTAHRSYRRLLVGGAISALGDRIGYIAFLAAVTHASSGVMAVGMLTMAEMLPPIIAAPIVSLMVDRFDRRKLMFWSDIARAGFFLIAALYPSLWIFYTTAFMSAAFTVLFEPSRQALEPHYVPEGEITQANGIRQSMMSVVMICGPAIGGLLAGTVGFTYAFLINAVSFLGSAYMVRDLDPVERRSDEKRESIKEELLGGFRLVNASPSLKYLFIMFAVFTLVIGIQFPLIYVFVKEVLHGGPTEAGWLFSAVGVGGLLGGAALASLKKEKQPFDLKTLRGKRNIALLAAIDGVLVLLFAVQTSLIPTMIFFGMFGFVGTAFHAAITAAVATESPEHLRGRVFALHTALHGPLIVLSIALGTPLAEQYGSVPVFLGSGILEIVVGAACLAWAISMHRTKQSAPSYNISPSFSPLRSPDKEG
ncbi:MAG TPA: MFS transporter [Candidatus Kapabacteria bacterium]|nr:MFS transporter [Candidatus Kapabacteria bacterium]